MQIDSEFLLSEIQKLPIDDWEKQGLSKLVIAELSGKTAAQMREILEGQGESENK